MLPEVDVNSTLCKTDLPCVRRQQYAQKAAPSQSRAAMKNVNRFNYWGLKMHHSFLLPSVLFPCCASGGEERRPEMRLCSQPRFNVTTLYFGSKNLSPVSRARSTPFTCKSPKCSRKLGGTVILYNELKLFVSLNCFNVDNLLLNFSQSRLAVSLWQDLVTALFILTESEGCQSYSNLK